MKKDGCNLSLNPLDRAYGNINTGGGYIPYTDYELGAQRIAEALHCILGSLHHTHRLRNQKWSSRHDEEAHIREELGIIKKCQREYSNKRYTEGDWWKGYHSHASEYPKESIKHIKTASKKLEEKAHCSMMQLLNHRREIDPGVFDVSFRCYSTLKRMAQEMGKSVRDQGEQPGENALGNVVFECNIEGLEESIDSFFR